MIEENQILDAIAQTIFDKKGSNILALDLKNTSNVTDYVVIAEGNVDRHVIAIAKAIEEKLSELGLKSHYIEGLQTGDWVVLDYSFVMIHLFMPGLREKYRLEELWKNASIVDVKILIEQSPSL